MNQREQQSIQASEISNYSALLGFTCHLMTLYAMRPCVHLAENINRHMNLLLDAEFTFLQGEWKGTFQQLSTQWQLIAEQHKKQQLKNNNQKQNTIFH